MTKQEIVNYVKKAPWNPVILKQKIKAYKDYWVINNSKDVVLRKNKERYVVNEELLEEIKSYRENKEQLPIICYVSEISSCLIKSQDFNFDLIDENIAVIDIDEVLDNGTLLYVFDTYENALKYYNR